MSAANVGRAYDAIAGDYDRLVAGDGWMRRRLWEAYARSFTAGQHVLDLSCGTGLDAVFLAKLGIRVSGIDLSPAMIDRFRANVRSAGVEEQARATVRDIADLSDFSGLQFDGAISAFAGLNTTPDLLVVAEQLARILPPGGQVFLHVLNRFSLWEWLGLVARGHWVEARRLGTVDRRYFTIGGQSIEHALYDPIDAYERFFARHFRLRRSYGLGIFRPPHTVGRFPSRVIDFLDRVEVILGGSQPFVRWGRFFVLELERRP